MYKCVCVGNEIYRIVIVIVSIKFYLIGMEASRIKIGYRYVWMDDMQKLGRWMLADTAKYPFPFPFFSFFSSFFRFFYFFRFFFSNDNGTSLQFGVACKQAQPLLAFGPCPVGRPGMGRWFLMDDY